jgi:hypothetical protein
VLTAGEIARGVQGALKFLQLDTSASSHFDNTRLACLRSFRVMALVAPVYALGLAIRYAQANVAADGFDIAFVEVLRFVVDWLLYPVLFFEIARRRDWLARYPRYISALNWINLPAVAVLLVFEVVVAIAPISVVVVLQIVLQALFFFWFVVTTRLALGVGWGMAGILMVVNWVPSFLLSVIVSRLLGIGAGG